MTARELMTEYLAAARRGDWETAFGWFADDLVIHIPGRSRFAGDHRGKAAAVAYINAVREHYHGGEIEVELVDMLESDERVVLLVRERFHKDGQTLEIRRANVYRIENGAIAEISIFEGDQYAADELAAGL